MDRKEIKREAREKIKGNIWNLIWPLLVIGAISGIISTVFGGGQVEASDSVKVSINFASTISTVLATFLTAGYIKYLLNFVRNGKFNTNDIINTLKEKWLNILIAEILVSVIVALASCLLLIPGIILGLAYSFAMYLVVDKDIAGNESLKASREMMKGYKWDYFVFLLSFLGWCILGIFTLGILYIWLIPYVNVAGCLYYEKLKEIKK